MLSSPPALGTDWQPGDVEYRRLTIALFLGGFAVFAQVFGAQAILPALSTAFAITESQASLPVSATAIGLAASVLGWSWLADRFGASRMMSISLICAGVISLAVPFAPNLTTLVVARALLGVAIGAVPSVGVAVLAEKLAPARVTAAAGLFVAGNTLGGITARLLAGVISGQTGWRPAELAIASLASLASVGFILIVPHIQIAIPSPHDSSSTVNRIWVNLRNPAMLGLFAQGLLLMGAFGAVYNYLAFRLNGPPFHVPIAIASLAFTAYLFGTAASRISAYFATRFGHLRILLSGIALMLIGLGLLLSTALWATLLGLVIFTIGCFSAHPLASGLSGQRANTGRRQATALYQMSWLAGTSLFGWLAGVVLQRYGWTAAIVVIVGLCVVAGVIALISWPNRQAGNQPLRNET